MMLSMMLSKMLPTNLLFDSTFCSRLGLMLLHSLWQVALLAMIAWCVERFWLKRLWLRQSVERGYAVYVAALLLALVAMPVTFWGLGSGGEWGTSRAAEAVSPGDAPALNSFLPHAAPSDVVGSQANRPAAFPAPTETLSTTLSAQLLAPTVWQRAAPWLVVAYGLGVVLMLVRLVRAWVCSNRLGNRAEKIVDGPLVETLRSLARQWSMRVVPVLAETQEMVLPKVVGLARPMILLPTAAIAGLSPDELEMILAHELAHVRRHDMWVNLLQRLAEVVLFFNPALWYLSRRISTLREYCCDEMTCQLMANTELKNEPQLRYATALLHVAELAQPNAAAHNDLAALAATGRSPSELRRRVARLFGEPMREPVRVTRGGLFTLVAIVLLIAFGPAIWRTEAQTAEDKVETSGQDSVGPQTPATISGKIVLEDGTPSTVKGWLHTDSMYSTGPHSMMSSLKTEGHFTDTFSCEVHPGTVWLKHFPGKNGKYAPAWVGPLELKPGQRLDDVTIVLKPGFSQLVKLTNEQGEPVADATLVAHPVIDGSNNGPNFEKKTDAKGEYLLEHLADTRYTLSITAPGYQPLRTAPLRVEPGEVLRPTMIRSRLGTGVVRFADGTPAPGSKLYCKHEIRENGTQNSYSSNYGELFTTCDASGRFSLDQLATGSHYLFLVEAVDGARGIVTDLRAGLKDVQIVLPQRRDLFVKIKGDISSLPKRRGKPYVKVQQRIDFQPTKVMQAGELISGYATIEPTDKGGTAIFRGLAVDLSENAESQKVEVLLGGNKGPKKVVDLILTGGTNVKFELPSAVSKDATKKKPPENSITIRVTNANGKPIADAKVFQNHVTHTPKGKRATAIKNHDYFTDADGEAVITWAGKSKDLRIWISKPGFVPLHAMWAKDFQIDGDKLPKEFEVVLEAGTEIGGTVIDERGEPIEGVKVEIEDATASSAHVIRIDDKEKPGRRPSRVAWLSEGETALRTDSKGRWLARNVPVDSKLVYSDRGIFPGRKISRDDPPLRLRFSHPDYKTVDGIKHANRKQNPTIEDLRSKTVTVALQLGADKKSEISNAPAWPTDPLFPAKDAN